jgi:predicted oxidoreductase
LTRGRPPAPVAAFQRHGADFVHAASVAELAVAMNNLTGDDLIEATSLRQIIEARDAEIDNPAATDPQVLEIRKARSYLGDKITRVAKPHRLLDPDAGPLIAVRLNILTRKSLGGIHTDLDCRVLRADGTPLPGIYAAGEAAGFGGGGVHGYRALEGTFLGGCLFSGRTAGRVAAAATQ